jgi:DNA gyrase subunit A
MSSEVPDPSDADVEAADVERVRIEDEMEQSYIDYAMSVIAGRALPDVRDGLKPVQRRVLYAMHEEGIAAGGGHRKSSSVVGDTMGNYHPHGGDAIYDTLVRMAQDFSLRYPLVDGQGNFGSMDGDPPAAMRYTEARMAPIAEELLTDIEADTVDFVSNYDDRLTEPAVLPAAFPNLLVNGSSGIAVGMSTNIPPHNLGEVIDATVHLLRHPDCSVTDLAEHVAGPDFPTGGEIVGRAPVRKAYETGRGRIRMRAAYEIERARGGDRIVVAELPYQQNKASLVEKIAADVNEGELSGIRDLRDESDRDGVRIVIELKRGANTEVVENRLLDDHFEKTFGVINLALVDGQPKVLDLKETLEEYVDHRTAVVRRRSEHELGEAEDRAHILQGRLRALESAEDVVEAVRDAEDRDAARAWLREDFGLSEEQAEHVVRMQLGSLTSLEAGEVRDEYDEVTDRIERLETILEDDDELRSVVVEELESVKAAYDDERRTRIVEGDGSGDLDRGDFIDEHETVIVLTEADYIKRMPVEWFEPQHRGGKGIIGIRPKDGDRVARTFRANSHDRLLCFTDRGQVYDLQAYDLPAPDSRRARGSAAVNVLDLDDGEQLAAVVPCDELDPEECVVTVTREGYVKRTLCGAFENILSTGIIAADLGADDELVDVTITDGDRDLVIATREGMTIRFDETEVRSMGRTARGVRGVDLREGDAVAGVVATDSEDDRHLLTVTRDGYGKRTPLSEYRPQSRYGMGLVDIKTGDRNGPVSCVKAVDAADHLIVMTEQGQIMRTRASEVSAVNRNTKGVKVMTVEDEDRVAAVDVLPATAVPESRPADEDGGEDEGATTED